MAKTINTKGLKKFKTNPQIETYAAPTDDKEFTPKKYVDDNDITGKFGGDGSDGAKTVSGNETLNTYKTFNWTSLTLSSGTLSFGSNFQNKVVRIKIQGDLVFSGGNISLYGLGSLGGAGGTGACGSGANGNDSDEILDTLNHGGQGMSGGAKYATIGISNIYLNQKYKVIYIVPGAGGAGGNATVNNGYPGGDGGKGGGAIIIEVKGSITFSGSFDDIKADGIEGESVANCGGGGGGGAGGMVWILYNGSYSGLRGDGKSINIDAGGGGSATSCGPTETGGGGGGGAGSKEAAGSNGVAGTGGGGAAGGDGGAGAIGTKLLEKNQNFV